MPFIQRTERLGRNSMRPIFWGLVFLGIGAAGWVFSVVLAVITLGAFKILTYVFGYLFILSLPVAAIWEFTLWIKTPSSHKALEGKGKNENNITISGRK